jgi:hypothetical protein
MIRKWGSNQYQTKGVGSTYILVRFLGDQPLKFKKLLFQHTLCLIVQGEPNLETCESDISPKPYSRLTIPPPPHMPMNKAIQDIHK